MDGAPSGQAEQFPLTSVGKSFLSASGIEPTEDLCLHFKSSPLTHALTTEAGVGHCVMADGRWWRPGAVSSATRLC
eukprot:162863-Prymnesium_polylepis.1